MIVSIYLLFMQIYINYLCVNTIFLLKNVHSRIMSVLYLSIIIILYRWRSMWYNSVIWRLHLVQSHGDNEVEAWALQWESPIWRWKERLLPEAQGWPVATHWASWSFLAFWWVIHTQYYSDTVLLNAMDPRATHCLGVGKLGWKQAGSWVQFQPVLRIDGWWSLMSLSLSEGLINRKGTR